MVREALRDIAGRVDTRRAREQVALLRIDFGETARAWAEFHRPEGVP